MTLLDSLSKDHAATKFYQQDIVQRISDPTSYGMVLRCWHDADDVPQLASFTDPLIRQLKHGEVGVSFLAHGGECEILLEAELKLVDRTLQPGDFCKRSIDDVCSGVVTDVRVRGRIQHVISGEPAGEWRTLDELESRVDAEIGDYVVYDNWIGQVIELYDESIIQASTGELVRLPELSSRLSVGEKGTDLIPPPSGGMYNLFGFFMGAHRPGNIDTVIAVKHTVYAVAWLAVNQTLDPAEAETTVRPQRFWYGDDIGKLTLVRGRSDLEMRVGDRVRLKNNVGVPSTSHGTEGQDGGVINVQTFMVIETETSLSILWQDGTEETMMAKEVIPYMNPDEYDCWPGDHVYWKCEDIRRPAIVQSVNALDRTASILLPDTGITELVSVLELDPHGTSTLSAVPPQPVSEGLGVRRGDFVFVHRNGTTNGFETPFVPKIGELEPWIRETPFIEGHLTGWRKEMSDIGNNIATCHASGVSKESPVSHITVKSGSLSWLGEVIGLNINGTIQIAHPDQTVKNYPLSRLTKLYDGIEQLENDLWEDEASTLDSPEAYREYQEQMVSLDGNKTWQPDNNADEWEDLDDDDTEAEELMDTDMGHMGWADGPEPDEVTHPIVTPLYLPVTDLQARVSGHPYNDPAPEQLTESDDSYNQSETLPWTRFDILPSAPQDHAFFTSSPAQPTKSFLSRLTKEYRVLSSSLPDTILVRTYEDRTDLIRCLILGPANTPYEDAPFMIDWMLDSNFPHSPPIAHFHSWTNGNGRVNPNLYEEGKVCLSILGTWAGDRDETWSAARSSLLQAFISIQGLVLVKEPWFCEPAYDKLRGTEEGIVNSRLYNEKAYVLSRGFVRRALEIPLGGLETEMRWLYYESHRLEKVIYDARDLIEKSKVGGENTGMEQELAVPRLTVGGIITLERTLNRLQTILDGHT